MIPSQIREIRETGFAIISGNVVAYRDECEAGFAMSDKNRDLMVRVYLLELGNYAATTPMICDQVDTDASRCIIPTMASAGQPESLNIQLSSIRFLR
jgi:hypothetical protein